MSDILKCNATVNEFYMKRNVGKYVVVYGKVANIRNDFLYLNTDPAQETTIIVKNCKQNFSSGTNIKVFGKVTQDNTVDAINFYELENDFDWNSFPLMTKILNNTETELFFK